MKAFDPALASPFRVDWLVPLDQVTQDDYTRAIAEKAEAVLRAARFISAQQVGSPTDVEVRVWVEAANAPACVSVTWEPGFHAFGFHLLDETLKERLGAIVFREIPCLDGDAMDGQAEEILRAALTAIREAEEHTSAPDLANRIRHAERSVRIPVVENVTFDPGVEP